jgi:hypothetical protein
LGYTLSFPRLKKGQTLDYTYQMIVRPKIPQHVEYLWNTGGPTTTVVDGDLRIRFPANLPLRREAMRCAAPVTETLGPDGKREWRLVTSNRSAERALFFLPQGHEVLTGYAFSTELSFSQLAQWFRGLCVERGALPPAMQEVVRRGRELHQTDEAVAVALARVTARDVRYVSVALGMSAFQPQTVADTVARRYGDCKDKSLLLQSFLREAGLPASMVLVGSGVGRTFFSPHAMLASFDHCIVMTEVAGKRYFIDPTIDLPFLGWLPPNLAGAQALVVGEDGGEVVTLPPYQVLPQAEAKKTRIQLQPDGGAEVVVETIKRGPRATQAYLDLRKINPVQMRQYLEASFKKIGSSLIDLFYSDEAKSPNEFVHRVTYTMPRFAVRTTNGWMFSVVEDKRGGSDWTRSLLEKRTLPFRFFPRDEEVESYEVKFPEGAQILGDLTNLQINKDFLSVNRTQSFTQSTLLIQESYLTRDASVAPTRGAEVAEALSQYQNHRTLAYIYKLPGE